MANVTVTTIGNPSGIAATAKLKIKKASLAHTILKGQLNFSTPEFCNAIYFKTDRSFMAGKNN